MSGAMKFVAVASLLAIVSPLVAQQRPGTTPPANQPGQITPLPGQATERRAGDANSKDSMIATCLVGDNQNEITLAKIAQERASDRDVKKFADMMVKDHNEFVQKLEKFAGNQGAGASREGTGVSVTAPGAAVNVGRQPTGDQQLDFMSIKAQIGQRCLELTREDWKNKEGRDFDRCYITQQIVAHTHVLAALEVLSQHASGELRQVLDKGVSTTKEHLDEAKKIAKALQSERRETAQSQ